ncbi:MAG: nucleic acid-binding protein [Clostridia bacterium]|nr:nucleic acid-binding protein [Clostridia bacterium]
MRKCLRCESTMIEDLEVKVSYGGYGVVVKENGIFKKTLGEIVCAVCPQCGYIETYIDNTYDIKKLVEKDK